MIYKNGYPGFSIEKPTNFPYHPTTVSYIKNRQASGIYYGELKLNEARSFICVDEQGKVTVYTYRHQRPTKIYGDAINKLEAMDIPPCTVLDGGHLWRTQLKESKLWIFDVLIWDGQEVRVTSLERSKMLDECIITDETLWRPLKTDKWLKEFEKMILGKSPLIKKAALQYGIPLADLQLLIEGLVMKDKDYVLSYPRRNPKIIGGMFKMRLADLPVKMKPDFLIK